MAVRVMSDRGVELNAEFAVETDGQHLSLILESAGGQTSSGRPRNSDYIAALTLLLRRLRDHRAVILAVLLASMRVAARPEDERALLPGPVDLAGVDDIDQLRLDITSAQGGVGQPEGAPKKGNNSKRIQLRLDVPGYGPGDVGRLAGDLADPSGTMPPEHDDGPASLPTATDLLRSLLGVEVRTLTRGMANTILKLESGRARVRTDRSPDGEWVDIDDVQQGLDLLARSGTVRVSVDELGHRSSFVGAVLATLPDVEVLTKPPRVTLRPLASAPPPADDLHFGELDSATMVKVRNEQARLRKILAGQREAAECALCGHEYPLSFLVAAHIKKRAVCTDDERRDLLHVAMLACVFGCDALYEMGWISVDQSGLVRTSQPIQAPGGWFRDRLTQLAGRRCTAHCEASEPYFAWHRTTAFRGHIA